MAHYLVADKSWKLHEYHDYEAGCNINRKAFLRHIGDIHIMNAIL